MSDPRQPRQGRDEPRERNVGTGSDGTETGRNETVAPWDQYLELVERFRFYLALTITANISYGAVASAIIAFVMVSDARLAWLLLIMPASISVGFAAIAFVGVRDAIGLHRATSRLGKVLRLEQIVRSEMIVVGSALTFVFHVVIAVVLYGSLGHWLF